MGHVPISKTFSRDIIFFDFSHTANRHELLNFVSCKIKNVALVFVVSTYSEWSSYIFTLFYFQSIAIII